MNERRKVEIAYEFLVHSDFEYVEIIDIHLLKDMIFILNSNPTSLSF